MKKPTPLKKLTALILLSVMPLILLSACSNNNSNGENGNSSKVVYVYNWGEYIDEALFKDFKAQTGITVKYKTFDTNESLYSVLRQGGVNYDVIIPSDYMASRLISENMLEKLDFGNIPNFSLIDDDFKNPEYDPTGEYTVPYTWGVTGLIYNSAKITDTIDSWGALFDPKYAGQVLMFNNPRDAFGVALKYLGYSLNTTDPDELEAAFQLLKQQRALSPVYVMDQIYVKLESGEDAIGPYYAGDFLQMNNDDLRFVIPKEGSNWFVDAMCIPKGAANKQNAELFINFMTGTDVSLQNMEVIGYASPNREVAAKIDLDPDTRAIMYPSKEELVNSEIFINLPKDVLTKYDNYWIELFK